MARTCPNGLSHGDTESQGYCVCDDVVDRENERRVESKTCPQETGSVMPSRGAGDVRDQAGVAPGRSFSLSTIGPDRSLYYFHENAKQFVEDIVMIGFDDLPELNRKIQGLRAEIDQLELRACAIAGEQMDRVAREERETSVPPVEVS